MSSIPTTGVGLIVALAVSTARDYARGLEQLDLVQRSFRELRDAQAGLIADERQRVVDQARATIVVRLRELDGEAGPDALQRVRVLIEDVVRPFSRGLVEPGSRAIALPRAVAVPVGWRSVVDGLFTRSSIRPLGYTLLFGFPTLVHAPILWVPDLGLRFLVLQLVITYIVARAARALADLPIPRCPWGTRAPIFTIVSFAAGAGVALLSAPLSPLFAEHLGQRAVLMGAMGVIGATVYSAFISLLTSLRVLDDRLHDAEEALHEERVRVNVRLRAEMRALARFLHGPVQDALSAAAFRIRGALDSDERSAELMAELRASIRASLEQLPDDDLTVADTDDVLTQIACLWQGIAEVEWSFDDGVRESLARHPATRSSFNELVREACSNAVKHGDATLVRVHAALRGREVLLTVHNVGAPIGADTAPGFGTRLFDELTLSWLRLPTADGTQLQARLPLSEQLVAS